MKSRKLAPRPTPVEVDPERQRLVRVMLLRWRLMQISEVLFQLALSMDEKKYPSLRAECCEIAGVCAEYILEIDHVTSLFLRVLEPPHMTAFTSFVPRDSNLLKKYQLTKLMITLFYQSQDTYTEGKNLLAIFYCRELQAMIQQDLVRRQSLHVPAIVPADYAKNITAVRQCIALAQAEVPANEALFYQRLETTVSLFPNIQEMKAAYERNGSMRTSC